MALAKLIGLDESTSFLIAILAISVAVGIDYVVTGNYITFFIIIVAVLIAFLPHELAHRNMARRLGCYSRYVIDPLGLFITLLSGFLAFIGIGFIRIIIPGYVLISSPRYDPLFNKRIEGLTAIVGPLVNIVISIALTILYISTGLYLFELSPLLYFFIYWTASINAWLALFNLIPIPPLDGSKILSWKPITWIIMFASAVILFYLSIF